MADLRNNGYDAVCDVMERQKETSIHFPKMMAENLQNADKVIVVLSKKYKEKADRFEGGVGSEYQYIIEDIKKEKQKYILVTFESNQDSVTPDFLRGRDVISLDTDAIVCDMLLHQINQTEQFIFPPVNPIKTQPLGVSVEGTANNAEGIWKETLTEQSDELSQEEKIVIKALSLDDNATVEVNTYKTLSSGDFSIYIRSAVEKSRIDFNLSDTRRESVKWNDVVEGLAKKKVLEATREKQGQGKRYTLLSKGFKIADDIDIAILNKIPSLLDQEVDALSYDEKIMLKAASEDKAGKIYCVSYVDSISSRIATMDTNTIFASGYDAKETAYWEYVITQLLKAKLIVPLMGDRNKKYYKLSSKGYAIASLIPEKSENEALEENDNNDTPNRECDKQPLETNSSIAIETM